MSQALVIDGVDAMLHVTDCSVEERIGAAVVARVSCVALAGGAPAALGALDPVGRAATLTLRFHDVERRFALQVEEVEERDRHSRITLASPVGRLADTCDHRVFVEASATDIAQKILGEHGLHLDLRASRQAPRRPQRVQVFESDLAFCTRLLAEEGMSWFPKSDEPTTVVIADAPGTFPDTGASIPYREEGGLVTGRALHAARLRRRVATDTVSLRDYDFQHPMLDLDTASGDGALEWYEHPGGFDAPGTGSELAAIRLAERQAEAQVLEGEATEPELTAGGVFTVNGASEELGDDRWLVIEVTHQVAPDDAREPSYQARFRAVPARLGYRPPRVPPPARGGVGTAVVTGAPGEEISVDPHGRTRLLLRWDRRGTPGPQSSAYARVAQPQLAGSLFNPRVGWEELCASTDRAGESPLLLGRVYNAVQAPPTSLPAKRVESHFGTLTTPGGGSGNFLQISDAAGQEGFALNASGDYQEKTENDKVALVAVNDTLLVSGNRTVAIEDHHVDAVKGALSISVGGLRTVSTASNYAISAASETVIVGAMRVVRAGGDYTTSTPHYGRVVAGVKQEVGIEHQSVFTKGASSVLVGGSVNAKAGPSEAVGVAGAAIHKISSNHTFNVATYALSVVGLYGETFGSRTTTSRGKFGESYGKGTYDVKGAASYTGSQVVIEAATTLTIKAGGVTITMTNASITVQGNYDGSTASVEQGVHRYG